MQTAESRYRMLCRDYDRINMARAKERAEREAAEDRAARDFLAKVKGVAS